MSDLLIRHQCLMNAHAQDASSGGGIPSPVGFTHADHDELDYLGFDDGAPGAGTAQSFHNPICSSLRTTNSSKDCRTSSESSSFVNLATKLATHAFCGSMTCITCQAVRLEREMSILHGVFNRHGVRRVVTLSILYSSAEGAGGGAKALRGAMSKLFAWFRRTRKQRGCQGAMFYRWYMGLSPQKRVVDAHVLMADDTPIDEIKRA